MLPKLFDHTLATASKLNLERVVPDRLIEFCYRSSAVDIKPRLADVNHVTGHYIPSRAISALFFSVRRPSAARTFRQALRYSF